MTSADTDHEPIQVLIVGAGIGGLTLANICKHLGLQYLVLERSAAVTPVGAGISLAPNCLRVLDQLGFLPEIEREGQRLRKIRIFRNTTQWNMLDFESTEKTFGYPVYKIERHAFHSALYRAAGEEHVLLGAQVVDVVDNVEKKVVTVTLEDGREFSGQIVVGADGIRSATRKALAKRGGETIINSTIRFTGRTHMSGYTAPLEHLSAEEEGVGTWMLYDDSIFTTWPCKDKRQWFIGVQRADLKAEDRSVWKSVNKDMINGVYGGHYHPFGKTGLVKDVVGRSERVTASDVFEETSFPAMAAGRVALIGDAAHAMTSFFGQGACQAIEDATELGNTLHEYFQDENMADLSKLLDKYRQQREGRAKDLVHFSNIFALFHMGKILPIFGPLLRRIAYTYAPAWCWSWSLRWLYGYQPCVDALDRGMS
ncbi:FAD binding monooxygenase [Aspergillus bombycis]|uniref:FAD binding monooxygenase n=1 Tax=Aspergillus bombycis TaxID=109264 RepID=A0A1F7ZX43_9EURO|nr:FAD binding monooxygenase [Aspergillus bombycis]OGM44043.1 FAD binding monooxygenase [Aspergillus bombycis]